MQQWTVRDVMTPEVLTVGYDTPPAGVITTMTRYDVSALAVVDRYDSVLGIITRTDVLSGIEAREPERRPRLPWRRPVTTPSFLARSAGEMMSAPALTVAPEVTLAQAARIMRHGAVNRLLVTGAGRRLLGVVTAADLLKVYERPDEAIRADVWQVLTALPSEDVAFAVHDGVATMAGTVPDARTATVIERLVRDVPGVTAVRNEIVAAPPTPAPAVPARRPYRPLDGWWPSRRPDRRERYVEV
ncbi:CBS domain-containing protein [Actinoplanes sp. CA-142083]|uniref:CBS domain-containing protein n=1 Tax=Actinoplanes sp. CA-142083 TaxID=3239903 RepID=UPI003D8B44F5